MPEGATVKTSKAAEGYRYCNKLFAEERKCAQYRPEYRKEYRQNKELPLLEEYFAWLKGVHPDFGKSPSHEDLEALMPWGPDIQQEHRIPNSDAYTKTYLN